VAAQLFDVDARFARDFAGVFTGLDRFTSGIKNFQHVRIVRGGRGPRRFVGDPALNLLGSLFPLLCNLLDGPALTN
jgi:hypothetical protein